AILTPQTLSIITVIFPPERRGAAFGVWGAVAGVATVTGPTLGGFLVTYINWRWIFFVNVPVGLVALAGALLVVPDLRPGRRHRLDIVGVLLASASLFGIIFGLVEGERFNWGAIWGPITIPEIIAAGVVLFAVFVVFERFQAEPLMPLSLFSNRNFSISIWVSSAVAFAGLGLGMTFAPLTTVAMRNVKPHMAGAASGVLNTVRQVGGAIGSAVIGAVLQTRLATQLHEQAVAYSSQVPAAFRTSFVS